MSISPFNQFNLKGKLMNKQDLINKIAEFNNFDTKKQAKEFLEDLITIIKDEVIAGNDVTIPGFGKFENFTRENGVKTPKFRAFTAFKDAVKA